MNTLEDLYKINPLKACRAALRQTRHLEGEDRIQACDKLLGTYGVEAIRGEWQNGYWCDIVACYCNTGDTYALTVIQMRGDYSGAPSRFMVSSQGDYVERNEKLCTV